MLNKYIDEQSCHYFNLHGYFFFFFSSRRRHTRSLCDWSSDVCSSDLDWALPWRRVLHRRGSAQSGRPEKSGEESERQMKRSEERRVGKECRYRWSPYHIKENRKKDEILARCSKEYCH